MTARARAVASIRTTLIASAALSLALLAAGEARAACAIQTSFDPIALYGERVAFTVLRDGSPIGRHEVTFERRGADLIATSAFDAKVSVLSIPVYRFEYRAVDRWRDGCLQETRAETNDNGERTSVEARRVGDVMKVTGSGGTYATAPVFPTNHWHPGVIGATRVLNTITGEVNAVTMTAKGQDTVLVNGEPRPARHYQYAGELRNDVWYDAQGRWVKMRFAGKDDSTIDYVCETCARDLTARN